MNITAKNILTVGDGRYKIAPNLYLVVRRNGLSRSFVFRYTFDGKRKDLSLGDPAIIKIQMAKDEALKEALQKYPEQSFAQKFGLCNR